MSRDYWVLVFHQVAFPGPNTGTLGQFGILPNIHGDIRKWNRLCSVRYTPRSRLKGAHFDKLKIKN